MALKIANDYYKSYPSHDKEELIGTALLSLTRSFNYFNESKGLKFGTYASYVIQRDLWLHVRSANAEKRKKYETVSLYKKICKGKDTELISKIQTNNKVEEEVVEKILFQGWIVKDLCDDDIKLMKLKIFEQLTYSEIAKIMKTDRQNVVKRFKKIAKMIGANLRLT